MALINCPECEHMVSDTARKCPSCGHPLKKRNTKKIILIFAIICLVLAGFYAAYHFLVYVPQHIPEQAAELLAHGDYVGADRLFARLPKTEENMLIREQLYYESRIVAAAKAQQELLLFPDSMILSEVVVYDAFVSDEAASTDTTKVRVHTEPTILLHYLAKSKGGSMVDGFVTVDWEDGMYVGGQSVSDLTVEDSLPWYIDDTDYEAALDFWSEQRIKSGIKLQLLTGNQIGVFDLERCNSVIASTLARKVEIIPSGEVVVTPTPYTNTVTPTPEN